MAQIKAKALVKIGKPFQTACLMLGYGRLKTSAPGLFTIYLAAILWLKSAPAALKVRAKWPRFPPCKRTFAFKI
jgi:hypothetical protein